MPSLVGERWGLEVPQFAHARFVAVREGADLSDVLEKDPASMTMKVANQSAEARCQGSVPVRPSTTHIDEIITPMRSSMLASIA